MKKTIFFWLYFIVAIILAIYFSARFITSQMGRGPISNIGHIELSRDSTETNTEAIRMAIGVSRGTDIRSVDITQLNNRILKVPGIKNSSTRRLPNGNIIIKTKQHHAIALWTDGVHYYPLSDDGTKIDTPLEERDSNSIVFMGNPHELPENLTEFVETISVLSKYIDYVKFIESRRWNIHTKNGTIIYLPENNLAEAISKINVLNQNHKLLSREIEIIDMRNNMKILVQTKK